MADKERLDPATVPLFKPPGGGPIIALPPPRARLDRPFGEVLAARRSVRTYGARAMAVEELSTLLHHAAGVIRAGHNESLGDYALRPFPGGGARSELEVYVVAVAVAGVAAGAYHYRPFEHQLEQVRGRDAQQGSLVARAHEAAAGMLSRDPAVVLLITAVLARIMPKYPELGARLMQQDAGCLLQTMYLVSTAMGLAPCALGGGDEESDSRYLGLDPAAERLVGYFLVGPAPTTECQFD